MEQRRVQKLGCPLGTTWDSVCQLGSGERKAVAKKWEQRLGRHSGMSWVQKSLTALGLQ